MAAAHNGRSVDPVAAGALRLCAVGKTFPDGTEALAAIDLSVAPGDFISIVGPSGCGKSTLLRICAGLDRPTAGTVARGSDRIGYVFQSPTLLPWRSVRSNVELPMELTGVARRQRRERADRAIDMVGLAAFRQHRPLALSGGMRMRVSLARTLAGEPDLLLLDEPFGSLDDITRQELAEELSRLFATGRQATLLVTHSVAEAVFLSTEVVVVSPRPGAVTGRVGVPFDYPRDPRLRFDPAYARLVADVTELLRAGPPDGGRRHG